MSHDLDSIFQNTTWQTATIMKAVFRHISAENHAFLTSFGAQMRFLAIEMTSVFR